MDSKIDKIIYETSQWNYVLSKYIGPLVFIIGSFILFLATVIILTTQNAINGNYHWLVIMLIPFIIFFNVFKNNIFLIKKVIIKDSGIIIRDEIISWECVSKVNQVLLTRIDIFFNDNVELNQISISPRWTANEIMLWPKDSNLVQLLKSKINK